MTSIPTRSRWRHRRPGASHLVRVLSAALLASAVLVGTTVTTARPTAADSGTLRTTSDSTSGLLLAGPGVRILEEVLLAGDMVLARTSTGSVVVPAGSLLSREVELDEAANEGVVRTMVKPPEPASTADLMDLASKHREAGWTTADYGHMLDRAAAGESLQDIARTTAPASALGSRTFTYTGAPQYFQAPAGTTQLLVEAWGAQGDSTAGGRGGYVRGMVTVTPGQTLQINVGGAGRYNAGGWNGGGNRGGGSWPVPGGGGGASDVRQAPGNLSNRLVIAGGGGGPADTRGGDGGAPFGADAADNSYDAPQQGAQGGRGGSLVAGGGGGGGFCGNGYNGTFGAGGSGGPTNGYAGGGGGGGYYGGGGGGSGCIWGGAGGGGGSSNVANGIVTGAQYKTGVRAGDGLVIISWTADAMATAAAESEVFSDGCRLDQDFARIPPGTTPPQPRIYHNYGCFDRRYGQQNSSSVYIGDHSFSTGRTYDDWWLKGVRVLHNYVNGEMVAFDPIQTERTDCSNHSVGFTGPWGLSHTFERKICPDKIDPVTGPRNYTTAWSGTSKRDTEATHQAGTLKKAQGVASGYIWDQAVTVRACPNPIVCALDNLLFGP